MRQTAKLWHNAVRITLFTHNNCSLCTTAKEVLGKVQAKRPFDFEQIDIMKPGNEKWKDRYGFDVPVIHVQKANDVVQDDLVQAAQKLMHRFSEQDVEQKMDLANQG